MRTQAAAASSALGFVAMSWFTLRLPSHVNKAITRNGTYQGLISSYGRRSAPMLLGKAEAAQRSSTAWQVAVSAIEADQADWVAATGCDGFLFLWPALPGNRVPPVVRPGLARVSRCDLDGGACESSVPTRILHCCCFPDILTYSDVQVQAGPLHAMH